MHVNKRCLFDMLFFVTPWIMITTMSGGRKNVNNTRLPDQPVHHLQISG